MNITLISMLGAEKSAVGKKLAEKLKYEFIDIEEMTARERSKLTIGQIIDTFGKDKFLNIEEKLVVELNNFDNCVISLNDGLIYSAKAMNFLRKKSIVVFLHTSLDMIEAGIRNHRTREIIGFGNKSLKTIFDERLPLYQSYALIKIEITRNSNFDIIIRDIIRQAILLHKRENWI
jgi:shikimate kinase